MTKKEARSLFKSIISDRMNMYCYVGDLASYEDDLLQSVLKDDRRLHLKRKMIAYLESLDMGYELAKETIEDTHGYVCVYHVGFGNTGKPLPKNPQRKKLTESQHDGQLWITDEGRIGVWCEVDGFVAWLDEHKTMWISNLDEDGKPMDRRSILG